MPHSPRAADILSRAEAELRALIQEQLTQGLYGDVAATALMADSLLRLVNGQDCPSSPSSTGAGASRVKGDAGTAAPESPRRRSPKDYPQFARDGERLVKIAWSKRERAEYEHRAPRHVVQNLIDAVRKKKGEGKLFEAADILPIKDSATRQEIPSYQAYLALAWLRHVGLVSKKGRDGYVLKSAATSPERIAELWEGLPTTA
jgi:hypothetical protein